MRVVNASVSVFVHRSVVFFLLQMLIQIKYLLLLFTQHMVNNGRILCQKNVTQKSNFRIYFKIKIIS